jgi:hypothetical protein
LAKLKTRIISANIEPEWLGKLLLSLLSASESDFDSLEVGLQRGSVSHVAWSKRNLLELRIQVHHMLSSEGKAAEYPCKLLYDSFRFYEAISKLDDVLHSIIEAHFAEEAAREGPAQEHWIAVLALHRNGPRNTEAAEVAAESKSELQREGLLNAHFTRVEEMANTQGALVREELEHMKTICSLLLHRTALSIAVVDQDGLQMLLTMLDNSSLTDVVAICGAVRSYLDERETTETINP